MALPSENSQFPKELQFAHILNSLSIFSTIIFAIANELVAPGLGAFLQCNTLLPMELSSALSLYISKTKSSMRFPEKKYRNIKHKMKC